MNLIELKNVCKTYFSPQDRVEALKDVSLKLRQGESAAITGSGNAGKSTLLQIMGACLAPTSGEIYIEGQRVSWDDENVLFRIQRKKARYISKVFPFIPEFTVFENIVLPVYLSDENPDKDYLEGLIDWFRLYKKKDNYPCDLTADEYRRAAAACALSNRPAFLLADGVLDDMVVPGTFETLGLLKSGQFQFGYTLVISTWDKRLADCMDRQIELRVGQVVRDTRTAKIKA